MTAVDTLAEEMHRVIVQLVRRLRKEGAQHELSWSQLSAMARLETGGPMTIAALAREETVKPQSIGATVASLEKAGFVARDPHPSDGRQIMFSLTRTGRQIRDDGVRAKRKWLASAIGSKLNSNEQRELRNSFEMIERLMQSDSSGNS